MFKHVSQYYQLDYEKEYWRQLAHSYQIKVQELEKKVESLHSEIIELEKRIQSPVVSPKNGITIQNLKVNNIQSGAAFNIAERIFSTTKSDMDMKLGPNSMNIGDSNKMEHLEQRKVYLTSPEELE